MLPDLVLMRQRFAPSTIVDLAAEVRSALAALELDRVVRPGMRIGIPAGSRGIREIDLILRTVVTHIRALGAEPVVAAAMGSHGGGSAEGQMAVLQSLGITESRIGAPVFATVEAVEIGRTESGVPIYFDRMLFDCDGVLPINRVKPHTSFRGPLESGVVKMLVVGCGKAAAAAQFHAAGFARLGERLLEMGKAVLAAVRVVGGLAVLENQREETAAIVPVPAASMIETERGLQERARRLLPRLPVEHLHLLVVDQMGKNLSGTGMDTNVIGRMGLPGAGAGAPGLQYERVVVLDLSPGSHGNANGVGLADLVTRRLVSKIDLKATYLNTLTVGALERAKIPITLESDREVVETALRTLGWPRQPRVARIRNTLELAEFWASPAVAAELGGNELVEVVGEPGPWPFDEAGNLL